MAQLVFISYRRQRGYALAHLVNAELRSRGHRTFLDVAESDPGKFWVQAQAAIRSCRALVLICTNGSFQATTGDDWVSREISEAIELGRQIVPVFSQDFQPPSNLSPQLAQAIEYNGVSMDTQFHVAAFDHLSKLLGGRKRSEQRRRVSFFWGIVSLTLLASLVLGARNIARLNEETNREHEARVAATARSDELARDIAEIEKKRADERRAADRRQRLDDARSAELTRDMATIEKKRAEERRAAEERQRRADDADKRRKITEQQATDHAKFLAHVRHNECIQQCEVSRSNCESSCRSKNTSRDAQDQCYETCKQYESLCKQSCR